MAVPQPIAVTSTISGPGDRVIFPPTSVTLLASATSMIPSSRPSTSAKGRLVGRMRDSSAYRGAAPMAAMSLTLTARALYPMSAGVEKRRSKWMPSTSASVVSTCKAPRSDVATAASSPIPMTTDAGAGGRRRRICSMSPRSPTSPTDPDREGSGWALPGVVNGPRLADDGHLDLTGILELVFDAARDVF